MKEKPPTSAFHQEFSENHRKIGNKNPESGG